MARPWLKYKMLPLGIYTFTFNLLGKNGER